MLGEEADVLGRDLRGRWRKVGGLLEGGVGQEEAEGGRGLRMAPRGLARRLVASVSKCQPSSQEGKGQKWRWRGPGEGQRFLQRERHRQRPGGGKEGAGILGAGDDALDTPHLGRPSLPSRDLR